MKCRFFLAALLAVLPSACVRYTPHPLDAGRSALALTTRQLTGKVWTLDDLINEAVRHQPDVLNARAQYETARAAIRTAGERPNPTIALSPQVVTPFTSWIEGTYGVDFDWTIETAGKRSRRLDIAHAQVRAAAERVIDAEWKARVAVSRAMLDLYAAEQRAKVLNDAITTQDQLLKLLNQRIQEGADSSSISIQPRLLQAQLRLQASDAAKNADVARAALAEALGMSTSGLVGAKFSFAAFEHPSVEDRSHRRAALTHRADVLASLADYAAAEATLRSEVAKQYPDVHLNPGYQLDSGQNKWALGVGFTLPILNQNRGAIGEAEAKRKEAEVRFYAVQAKVVADCDRAAAALNGARAKLATADEMLREQERQIETEQRTLAAGEGDKVALLSAQVERATTLTARVDALAELQSAVIALEEATQFPITK